MSTFSLKRFLPFALTLTAFASPTLVVRALPLTPNNHSVSRLTIAQASLIPTGTYTAQSGTTTGTGRLTRDCEGPDCPVGVRSNRRTLSTAARNKTITISIDSFSPSSEIKTVRAAGLGNFSQAIKKYRHGTVSYEGGSYAINLATYRTDETGNYFLQLVSANPFSKSSQQTTLSVKGNTVAMIELRIPKVGGTGEGKLYQSYQVSLSKSGRLTGQNAVSAATVLNNVIKTR